MSKSVECPCGFWFSGNSRAADVEWREHARSCEHAQIIDRKRTEPDAPDEKYAPLALRRTTCAVCMRDFEAHDAKHLQAAFSQHMTDGTCKSRGSSDDAAREQSMRETAYDESYRNHESVSVVQHPTAPVYVIRDPEDDAEVHLPAEGLPKFVRELCAMMTEEQRARLIVELGRGLSPKALSSPVAFEASEKPENICEHGNRLGMFGGSNHVCTLCATERFSVITNPAALRGLESGPGISARPVKTEPLSFLDVDLLAADE